MGGGGQHERGCPHACTGQGPWQGLTAVPSEATQYSVPVSFVKPAWQPCVYVGGVGAVYVWDKLCSQEESSSLAPSPCAGMRPGDKSGIWGWRGVLVGAQPGVRDMRPLQNYLQARCRRRGWHPSLTCPLWLLMLPTVGQVSLLLGASVWPPSLSPGSCGF